MDVTDVWVANEEGTEIVRARDIAGVSLDYDGKRHGAVDWPGRRGRDGRRAPDASRGAQT